MSLSDLTQMAFCGMWEQNLTEKSTNLKEDAQNIKAFFFIRAALRTESLDVALNTAGVEILNMLGKLGVVINTEGHRI